jgi:hypothetical protein
MPSPDTPRENGRENDSPEYTRRKFTLTRRHNEKLAQVADENYGGNQSRCVRCAIDEIARTHDGENELRFQRILDNIDEIIARLDHADFDPEQYGGLRENGEEVSQSDGQVNQSRVSHEDVQDDIIDVLIETESEVASSVLLDETQAEPPELLHALASLIDDGVIHLSSTEEMSYQFGGESLPDKNN